MDRAGEEGDSKAAMTRMTELFGQYVTGQLGVDRLEELADAIWNVDEQEQGFIERVLSEPPEAPALLAPGESFKIFSYLRQPLLRADAADSESRRRADIYGERMAICLCLDASQPRRDRLTSAAALLTHLEFTEPAGLHRSRFIWLVEIVHRLVTEFDDGARPDELPLARFARVCCLALAPDCRSSEEHRTRLRQFCELTLRCEVPARDSVERSDWEAEQWRAMGRFRCTQEPVDDEIDSDPDPATAREARAMRDKQIREILGAAVVQCPDCLARAARALVGAPGSNFSRHDEAADLAELASTLVAIAQAHVAQERDIDASLRSAITRVRARHGHLVHEREHSRTVDWLAVSAELTELMELSAREDPTPADEARAAVLRERREARQAPPADIDPALLEQDVDELLAPDRKQRRGLALSGGGLRATCFHIGVMACLADLDLLRRIDMISCVSGGSIAGAAYAVRLKALLARKLDLDIRPSDYREVVADLVDAVTRVASMNLRARAFCNPFAALRLWLRPDYTLSERIADLLDRHLFAPLIQSHPEYRTVGGDALARLARSDEGMTKPSWRVFHRLAQSRAPLGWPLAMWDMRAAPKGERHDFDPASAANRIRRARCPELFFNTTSLNTGGTFVFSTHANGEPVNPTRQQISSMPTLSWRTYRDINSGGDLAPAAFRLSRVVAASAAVPGLLPPILFRRTHQDALVALSDGGVHDNQGFQPLIRQRCDWILASDAAAQLSFEPYPEVANFRVAANSSDMLMERIREMSYDAAFSYADLRAGNEFVALHLTRGLSAVPPQATFDVDESLAHRRHQAQAATADTGFQVKAACQALLAQVRTDLDCFSEIEVLSLMADGYLQSMETLGAADATTPSGQPPWRFMAIAKELTSFDERGRVAGVLAVARLRFLRLPASLLRCVSWQRWESLATLAAMAAVSAIVVLLWRRLAAGNDEPQVLRALFAYAIALAVIDRLPPQSTRRWLWKVATVPFLLFAVAHSWIVLGLADPIYRRLGRYVLHAARSGRLCRQFTDLDHQE